MSRITRRRLFALAGGLVAAGFAVRPLSRTVRPLVVIDGNSLAVPLSRPLSDRLGPLTRFVNFAVGGQTTGQMLADAETQIDPWADTRLARPTLFAWEVTNDLFFGASPTAAVSRYATYCTARRPRFRVIAATILPRSEPGTPSDFEQSLQEANRRIRAEYREWADALFDVAALPEFADELDTRWFADRVHLTPAGNALVADRLADLLC